MRLNPHEGQSTIIFPTRVNMEMKMPVTRRLRKRWQVAISQPSWTRSIAARLNIIQHSEGIVIEQRTMHVVVSVNNDIVPMFMSDAVIEIM